MAITKKRVPGQSCLQALNRARATFPMTPEALPAVGGIKAIRLVTFSVQLRAHLLASGKYIPVFPRSMMRLLADRMALKVLPIKLPTREWPVVMVTLKNRTQNPVVQLFIKHLREGAKSLGAEVPK